MSLLNRTFVWKAKPQSAFVIVNDMWLEFIGHRAKPEDYLQAMEMLQEVIRRTMREEHAGYLAGRCTRGRVAETRNEAILLGKIIAEYKRGCAEVSQ